MIYLLITTSINNRYGFQDANERKERYLYAISESLKKLPKEIVPIIIENNGKRETYLDNFYHYNKQHVKVYYTDNNKQNFKSKGVNEFLDIKEIIDKYGIEDEDIIIKLTGRYRVLTQDFFIDVIENENNFDAFIKFFGTCSLKFDDNDCILGMYAMRTKFIKLFNHLSIDNYPSAEIAFARYTRFSGASIKKIEDLHLECCFAEDKRILNV